MKKEHTFRKRISDLIYILFLAGIAVYFFQFNSFGYSLTVPLRGYTKVADNVYIDKNLKDDPQNVLSMLSTAENRLTQFWGTVESKPEIIITDDEKALKRLGWTGSPALTTTAVFLGVHNYILISPTGLNVDILAHELTHAELHHRLYKGKIISLSSIPVWFDEGVATQNDHRSDYSDETWNTVTNNGKNITDFSKLKSSGEFYDTDVNVRRYNYIISKHEVSSWIKKYKITGLIQLADAINSGKSFDSQYYR